MVCRIGSYVLPERPRPPFTPPIVVYKDCEDVLQIVSIQIRHVSTGAPIAHIVIESIIQIVPATLGVNHQRKCVHYIERRSVCPASSCPYHRTQACAKIADKRSRNSANILLADYTNEVTRLILDLDQMIAGIPLIPIQSFPFTITIKIAACGTWEIVICPISWANH